MGAESVQFESDEQRDARIQKNTRKLRRHEKVGLIVVGYLVAEGSKVISDLAGLLV